MNTTIKRIILLGFILILVSFIIIEGLMIYYGDKKEEGDVDYMIVLGARLYGKLPSPTLSERLYTALDYLKDNKDVKVVVTGGQGPTEDIEEAKAMKGFLVDNGIDKTRIIEENKSTSTYENLKFAKEKIKEIDNRDRIKILIVTSDFHILRAKFLASRLGYKPYGFPAPTPDAVKFKMYIREYFAIIKSFVFDR
ncbi:YdcF family protein [Dethiothermospora halolimnae]|uniref:YdcF family protein n=1 Tax=Dethiothermospora halolimnae TaxID=3114390 RepID=UPI003CCBEB80